MGYDFIVVGAGSAGCVVANRLSADPRYSVLLIENGPDLDNFLANALICMPKGVARIKQDPRYTYKHPTNWNDQFGDRPQDLVMRGKILGGSSALNGMIYHRGQIEDYDRWAELGNEGWAWKDIHPYFLKLEDHQLPANGWRAQGGPLQLSLPDAKNRLNEAIISAAEEVGFKRKEEPNLPDQRGISYVVSNIDKSGRRVSSARAFLTPEVRRRKNLTIVTDTKVERILFEGRRAVGVSGMRGDAKVEYRAGREVILSAGAYQSPALLQISGVGPSDHLNALGIVVLHHSPGVGSNLLDHWNLYQAYDLKHHRDSQNRNYRWPGLAWSLARYALWGKGPLALSPHQLVAFAETEKGTGRADYEILIGPYTLEVKPDGSLAATREPTMNIYSFPLRSTSRGWVRINSADPNAHPTICPNYLDTEYDRRVTVNGARAVRSIIEHPSLSHLIGKERAPAGGAQTDDEIIDVARRFGAASAHTCGTCKMGPDEDENAVVDNRLRVRGTEGLRVVDCSVFPDITSANTNGPVMALAWRASDLIAEDNPA